MLTTIGNVKITLMNGNPVRVQQPQALIAKASPQNGLYLAGTWIVTSNRTIEIISDINTVTVINT